MAERFFSRISRSAVVRRALIPASPRQENLFSGGFHSLIERPSKLLFHHHLTESKLDSEMENVLDRTKHKAENSKKFAIQNFSKSLLDAADNLGRPSSVVKESFSKIDQSIDSAGAVPLLKTLLEVVEMTEKQLAEVFRKYGVEKFDPVNEHFDPHRHYAVFQIPDASNPPGTVAAVMKVEL